MDMYGYIFVSLKLFEQIFAKSEDPKPHGRSDCALPGKGSSRVARNRKAHYISSISNSFNI